MKESVLAYRRKSLVNNNAKADAVMLSPTKNAPAINNGYSPSFQFDYKNISMDVASQLNDEEIIAIEKGSSATECPSIPKVKLTRGSSANISFAAAQSLSDAEIIALETGVAFVPPRKEEHFPPNPPPPPIRTEIDKKIFLDTETNRDSSISDDFHYDDSTANKSEFSHFNDHEDDDVDVFVDVDISQLEGQEFYTNRLRRIRFIRKLEIVDTRPIYMILVDASVSMFNQQYNSRGETVFDYRWSEAKKVVSSLAPKITKSTSSSDPPGASIVFFSDKNKVTYHSGIQTYEQAAELFGAKENRFKGSQNQYK